MAWEGSWGNTRVFPQDPFCIHSASEGSGAKIRVIKLAFAHKDLKGFVQLFASGSTGETEQYAILEFMNEGY